MNFFKKLIKNRMAVIGLLIVISTIILALIGPLLTTHDPYEINPGEQLEGPSKDFLLGTDSMGRDVLARIIYGARITLGISFLSILISTVCGSLLGIIAGYFKGIIDNIIMRIMDVFFSFPAIFLGLAIVAVLGSSVLNISIAISIVYIPRFARVARASVLSEENQDYVAAIRLLGARKKRIIFRHILPNITAPLIVQISLCLSTAILVESSLSFLGVGTQPPLASWGVMLNEGRQYIEFSPTLAIFPGLAIMIIVFGFNLLGDGLRDIMDPRIIK